MNPGLFVMGGGGDGGGSGAGNGKGKGGKQGANGKNGGNDANGDGKGAGSCGAGSANCPGPHGGGGAAAGHPVDVATGNVFTVPALDLTLPGPMQLHVRRQYNSASRDRDIGLGWGWSHSFAYRIEVRRRTLTIWKSSGEAIVALIPAVFASIDLNDGWVLSRSDEGFTLTDGEGIARVFHESQKIDETYHLTAVVDRNDNDIGLVYEGARLTMILDSVGRPVRVRYHRDGHIAAFEVKNAPTQARWIAYQTYEYDEKGDLVRVVDAEGNATTFAYDDHRMIEEQRPGGLRAVFVWDDRERCVESWCDHRGGPDPSLADDVPATLADGVTKAKGILHVKLEHSPDGYIEVVDSAQVRRFFTNAMGKVEKATAGAAVFSHTYDERGFETSYTDPTGATTQFHRDARGRVKALIDALGGATTYEYDLDGNLIEKVLPNGVSIRMQYDRVGNLVRATDPLGPIIDFAYDDRGLCTKITFPNGGVAAMKYDAHGNRVEIIEPDGATKRIAYDYLGRPVSVLDTRGHTTRYTYTDRNQLLRIELPNGGAVRMEYDADGRLARVADPDGRVEEAEWAGNDVIARVRLPGGPVVRAGHDREGRMITVHNEKNEIHHLVRDAGGLVVEERTFDGRVIRYKNDLAGRVIAVTNDRGDKTELVYDLLGRLIEKKFPDDISYKYRYDEVGNLVEAETPDAHSYFEYDIRGRRTKEITVVGGERLVVQSAFDLMNARTHKRTSLGYEEVIQTDVRARPARVLLGGRDAIESTFDPGGLEIARRLPGGAVLRQAFDGTGFLERKSVVVFGPSASPQAPNAPETTTLEKAYRFTSAGELVEEWDRARGAFRYQLDVIGQIVSKTPPAGLPEVYTYDESRNLHESAPGAPRREYGPAGRLTRKGSTEYIYDADARLVEKRTPRLDRPDDHDVWRYRWTAAGKLASVTRPDGAVIELGYDALDRRVRKVVRPNERQKPTSTTLFLWDHLRLAHELEKRANDAGDPIVEERTYVFSHKTAEPIAHRDTLIEGDTKTVGDWVFYVTNGMHAPEYLLSSQGEVLATVESTAFGHVTFAKGARATTPLRFEGQYADDETGLTYNYSRYYDPETGRYISADPIGIEGGMYMFAYVGNRPTAFTDQTGLADPVTVTMQTTTGTVTGHSQGYYTPRNGQVAQGPCGSLPSTFPSPLPGHFNGSNTCAECDALNQHFAGLDPDNPAHHDEIRRRAQSIQSITPTRDSTNTNIPPCHYCTQRMARLSDISGVNLFNRVSGLPAGTAPFTNLGPGGTAAVQNAMGSGSPFPYRVGPNNQIFRSDGTPVNAT